MQVMPQNAATRLVAFFGCWPIRLVAKKFDTGEAGVGALKGR
jgi:hypothetical protein